MASKGLCDQLSSRVVSDTEIVSQLIVMDFTTYGKILAFYILIFIEVCSVITA